MATDPIHPHARFALTSQASSLASRQTRMFHHHGFTLLEMLLALAVAAMVGTGVVMMLAVTAGAADEQASARRTTVQRQVAITRVATLTRCNAMLLASSGHHLVFWKGDANGDGRPNLSELRRIDWDDTAGELRLSEAPVDLPEAMDAGYDLDASFSSITAGLMGGASMPTRVVLQGIDDWQVTLDDPQPRQARLLRLVLRLTHDHGLDTVRVIAALRAGGP